MPPSADFVLGLYLSGIVPPMSLHGSTRMASTVAEIEEGLNPKTRDKARACRVDVKRVDLNNLRWIFSVDCGNGPKVVRMRATRSGRTTALAKMDLSLSCSCEAWRWLGPEHHAKREQYLLDKPRGTASPPVIKDPEHVNRVCKHVYAVLSTVRGWQIPQKRVVKKGSDTDAYISDGM